MLFKQLSEIHEYVENTNNVNFNNIKPSIKSAENQYIIPFISPELYKRLDDKINTNSPQLTAKETTLLGLIREALAPFAMYLFVPRTEAMVSDSGITRAETQGRPTAYKNQVRNLRESYLLHGYDALERCLSYLEQEADTFIEWKNSAERTKMNALVVRSGKDFEDHFSGTRHGFRLYRMMLSDFRKVEDLFLQPVYSNTLALLKNRQKNNQLTLLDKELLMYIKTSACNYALALAANKLQLRIDDAGITVLGNGTDETLNDDSKRIGANEKQISGLVADCTNTAKAYQQLAVDFLNANASNSVYPEWYATHQPAAASNIDLNQNLKGIYSM